MKNQHRVMDSAIQRVLLIAGAALMIGAAPAPQAQAQSDPAPDPSDQPADSEESDEARPDEDSNDVEPMPSLDDLLDIPTEEGAAEEGGDDVDVEDVDPQRAELDRALEGVDISEMFAEAVRQMDDAADLLERARDPGVRTQRIQDEILRKLDVLIEKAEQSQSSSSSSSSSSQQQQQSPTDQQQQQQQSQEGQSQSGEPQEGVSPGRQDGPLGDALDAAKAAWGSLPDRVRSALVEGADEEFSSIYKRMTEEYYRRLAEQREDQP